MNRATNIALWTIYLALLAVLLPHTAWAFSQFEPDQSRWLGWIGAIAFEGAIAALTLRLKQRFESTPNFRAGRVNWKRFKFQYVNWYGLGLLVAVAVSSAANWAHAVEFGQPFDVFTSYSIDPLIYSVAFGGILPLCSFLFARILADVRITEHEVDPELERANATIQELRRQVRETERRATLAEQRFQAIGDLAIMLTAEDKRQRILATHQRWPELPAASIAVVTDASRSYVSEVLSES